MTDPFAYKHVEAEIGGGDPNHFLTFFGGGGWGTTRGADLKSYYKLCFEISIISFSIAIVSPIIIVYEIT